MTQIHLVIRRINPALKVDLVQVGYIQDGRFVQLPLEAFKDGILSRFLKGSSISDTPYIEHSELPNLLSALVNLPAFCIDFFDNTLVLIFDFDLDLNEISTQKEG